MSIQSQIDRINNAKSEIASAISAKGVAVAEGTSIDGLPALIRSIPQEGGSGGGIIEVPELPTENINENAVYKVVVNEEPTVYMYQNGAYNKLEDTLLGLGLVEINAHFVDELPSDMLETDTSTGVFHGYIVISTGICYAKINSIISGTMTAGALLFSSLAADKGYTEDITLETENGIYVQRSKSSIDWFIRENGEWKRISPDTQTKTVTLTKPGVLQILPDEGKVLTAATVNTGFPTIGNLIEDIVGEIEITEECFVKFDGTYVTSIRSFAFAHVRTTSIVIPDSIRDIGSNVFYGSQVKQITFKGKPVNITNEAFKDSNITTINVPWNINDGVSGAPWGATNATINYNYTGE